MIKCYRGNILPKEAKATENSKSFGCDACEYMENNELIRCSKFIVLHILTCRTTKALRILCSFSFFR